MKKLLLAFFALPMFTFGQTTDLLISEYGEGAGGNKKYIEIYNGTGAAVNLDDYRLWRAANGGGWNTTPINFTAGTTLANGGTWIFANNSGDVLTYNQLTTDINFNGDDAIGLVKNISGTWTLIDVFGTPDNDPGTGWAVAGINNATVDKILIRKASVCSPNTNWTVSAGTDAASSEWEIAINNYASTSDPAATAGNHTANCSASPSTECGITTADLTALLCDNNGTANDPNDDFLTFNLNPTGSNLGANGYTVSVSSGTITPTTGTYGAATSFQLQGGSAGDGDVVVTITDADSTSCSLDVTVTDPGVCSSTTPIITVAPATLTGFNHMVGIPSASQTFTTGGIALTEDITLTASTGFEISLTSGGTYTPTLVLPHTSGTVAPTTIYVRGNSAVYGAFSGNVVATSTGADNDSVVVSGFANDYVYYTIDQIDGVNANGVADSLNVLVKVSGVVHCMDFRAGAGYNMTIIDGSGKGIYVFSNADVSGYTNPEAGDSITVKGKIAQFNGLLQVTDINSIVEEATGVATNTPIVVTAMDETTENQYITLNNVTLVTPIATFPTAATNLDVTNGTTTFQLRILPSTDLGGTPAPQGPFNVTGIGTQFDSSNPFTTGYQMWPCGTDAIEIVCAGANLPTVTTSLAGKTITANATGTVTYKWINCADNALISGATAASYSPSTPGSYAVIVDNGTCSDTSACVTVDNLSVGDVELGQAIVTFPNPVQNELTINNYSGAEVTFVVVDINGKVITETTTLGTNTVINTASWNKGVYFVNFVGSNKAAHTVKIVK